VIILTEESKSVSETTIPEINYCRQCGYRLPKDARYCPSCGTAVQATEWEEYQVSADNLISKVKELVHEGNVRRIIVRSERGETLLDIPVTVGVIGALFAPYLAALGTIAALVTRCNIAVERRK
jgi:RNA polymerase subunit RPABC4/transcription elongation factor Spt4